MAKADDALLDALSNLSSASNMLHDAAVKFSEARARVVKARNAVKKRNEKRDNQPADKK